VVTIAGLAQNSQVLRGYGLLKAQLYRNILNSNASFSSVAALADATCVLRRQLPGSLSLTAEHPSSNCFLSFVYVIISAAI
jgi:hypothetical protein